jgi:DNA-binding PadR family transcriptional regulator
MSPEKGVWQGTLALMVLKTLASLGPLHGYGIARPIEQTSGDICSEGGTSGSNRKDRYCKFTRAGRKQLESTRRKISGRHGAAREWPGPIGVPQ